MAALKKKAVKRKVAADVKSPVTNTDEEQLEERKAAFQEEYNGSLRVVVKAANYVFSSKEQRIGAIITLPNEQLFDGSKTEWLDRPNTSKGLRKFRQLAPPDSFRRAMQEIAVGAQASDPTPESELSKAAHTG